MSKVIVALDGMTWLSMIKLADVLKDKVWGFKVNDALLAYGARVIKELKTVGAAHVMADPKLFDIPNTVSNGVKVLRDNGADFITVHALAGPEVLKAAVQAAGENTKILAITVLTSDNQENRDYEVRKRAYVAQTSGVHGLVCAGPDLEKIKDIPLFKVVPGIRPTGQVAGEDQVHVSSMIPELADFVVIGRPITQAADPLAVVKSLA